MLKRLKYIGSLLLLIVALQAGGQSYVIDSVCVNTERQYRVNGELNSTYSWMLTDESGDPVALPAPVGVAFAETDPVSGSQIVGTEISIQWSQVGIFNLKVIQYSPFGCDTLEQGTVKVFELPLADAGPDVILCPNAVHVLAFATASHYSALRWTHTGDGTFDNDTTMRPVYTPGPNDLLTGMVELTLTAEGKGSGATCIPAIDRMVITIQNLTAKLDTTGITCYQANDASIHITDPLGGQGGYQYSINEGVTWQYNPFFENLGEGSYVVQMRDTIMQTCVATIDTIGFVEPEPLSVDSIEIKQITCLGNDGSISLINPQGGLGAYEFSLNENAWQSSVIFTGLLPDSTYIVWIRDALYNKCQISLDTIRFKQPDPLMADTSHVNVLCYGGNDGTISLSNPRNGSGTYQYKLIGFDWTSGVTDFTFDQLAAGDYTVLIRDFKAPTCIDTLGNFHLVQPDQLTAQVDSTRITCFGANDGMITFSNAQGGSGEYRYSIDNGESWAALNSFTNLEPGRYDVWVGDQQAQACKVFLGVVWIGEPKPLTADVDSSPITCRDAGDGVIQISNAQQGTLPYQYSINGVDWKDSPLFQSVIPGSYIVRMKDWNGCIQSIDTIAFQNPEPLMAILKATNATCLGNDGTIQFLSPGNAVSNTYQFAVSNTPPTASLPLKWQSEGEFKQLPSDTFVVWIRDSLYQTCEIFLDTLIIEEPKPLAAEFILSDVTCYGGSNGSIQVTNPRGGSGRFEFRLLNTSSWKPEPLILNLRIGDYILEMRDSISPDCWITVDTLHLDQPPVLEAEPIVASNVGCHGGNDGVIRFENVRGGNGSAEFSLNGSDWFENEITSLQAGTFNIQMRDRKDTLCIVQLEEIIITEPLQIMAALVADSVSCYGGNDGQVTIVSPVNGTAPYSFSIDGGLTWQTEPVFAGLTAGHYPILVKDSKDCTAELDSVKVEQPQPLVATPVSTAETISGAYDGTITMTKYSGGSGIYTFSIDSLKWQSNPVFDSLVPREYRVWILDANTVDCMRSYKIKVEDAGTIFFAYDLDSVKCSGGNDGRITFTNPVGATKYEYSIDGGINWSTDPVFNGKIAGAYELLVHNADDVTKISNRQTIQLMEPGPIEADIRIISETNPDRKDGSLEILSPHGGSGGYQYRLDDGVWGTTVLFTGLTEGNYTLWIKDKYNCQKDTTVTIPPAGSLTISVLPRNVTCRNGNDGQITYEKPLGGSGLFDYNTGAGWESFTGSITSSELIAGTYTFLLRDANDPVNEISIVNTIDQPLPWYVNITALASGTKTNLTANVSGAGGVPPFDYLWSDGQKNQKANNLDFGFYSVTVTDAKNCAVTSSYKLGFMVSAELVKPILCPGEKATIRVKAWDGGSPFKLTQSGTTFTDKDSVDLEVLPSKTPYSFEIENAFGNRARTIPILLTEPKPVTASVTVLPVSCTGDLGKIILSNPSGGMGQPYQYRINEGAWTAIAATETDTISDLLPGKYKVELQELGSSCIPATWDLTIDDLLPITLSALGADALCTGVKGSIKFTFTNIPDGSYTITYSEGSFTNVEIKNNSATVQALPGIYLNLKLTFNGCFTEDGINASVEDGEKLDVLAVRVNPDCLGRIGSIKISSPIGSNYMYSINGGTSYSYGVHFTDLAPGKYSVRVKEMTSECESPVKSLTILPIPASPVIPKASVSQPDCKVTTGTIVVSAPLGTAYQYSIDGINYQAGPEFANLDPSIYPVTVKDLITGCNSAPLTLTVNPGLGAFAAPVANVTAHPDCILTGGVLQVTSPLGAVFQYSVNGTTYQNNPQFDGLASGSYSVTVKNLGTGCISKDTTLIVNTAPDAPEAPVATVTKQPVCTLLTGTIEVSSPLGAGFLYSKDASTFQSSPVFADLVPNSYGIRVKEIATGCVSAPFTLTVIPAPDQLPSPVAMVTVQPDCMIPSATIRVTSPLGAMFTYSMDGGEYQSGVLFEGLIPGSSPTFKVKDSSTGCESLGSTIPIDPLPLNPETPDVELTVVPSCNNLDGTVTVLSPTGVDYLYSIDGGEYQESPIFDKLQWGEHSVTVKNQLTHCVSAPGKKTVPANPPPPVITAVIDSAKCFGGAGMISLSVTNAANGVYTVKYDGGEFPNVSIFNGKATIVAPGGTYNSLSLYNATTGCDSYNPQKVVDITIEQPAEILITASVVELDLTTNSKASIDLSVTGGTGGYSYRWDNGLTSPDIDNLSEGTYRVTVTDSIGCYKDSTFRIQPPNYPPVAVNDIYSTICSVVNGSVTLNDTDPENDRLFIAVIPVVQPLHGTLTLNDDGTFMYVANPMFTGTDSFVYALFDKTKFPGITATVTLHIVSDRDHDGIADDLDPDADGDGILNIYEALSGENWPTADSDGDGLPNYLDIDSDGDGIVDNRESQSTGGYKEPVVYDANSNGVNDAYDKSQSGYEIQPIDTDGDGIPDFLDTDSDNDGVPDRIEGHDSNSDGKPDYSAIGKDEDGDGLDDGYDSVFNECNALENVLGSYAAMQDFDHDGFPDWRDEDDDNDKLLTKYEDLNGDRDWSNDDMNLNGYPEYLDYGRDCDMFIPNAFSPNNDNINDYFQIYCIHHHPNAKMYIFDQLGTKLFEKANYGNLDIWENNENAWWTGKPQYGSSSARKELVPAGTYYYVLDLGNGEVKKSFVFVSY